MKYVKMQFGGNIAYSNNETQASRGVMLGFSRRFDPSKIGRSVSFDHGNLLLQEFMHSDKTFLLATVYGPNEDRPEFYDNV